MAIGINLTENIRVELGEIKEKLISELDIEKIQYSIPFDKTNKQGVKETLITMRDPNIEISAENDIITYIKTDSTEFSNLDKIDNSDVGIAEHIKNIQEQVIKKFESSDCSIKIEKIDTKTLNITLIVTHNSDKARVQIVRDSRGQIYINTIIAI